MIPELPNRGVARVLVGDMPRAMLSCGFGVDVVAHFTIETVEIRLAHAHDVLSRELRILAIAPASLSHLVVSTDSCFRPCGVRR